MFPEIVRILGKDDEGKGIPASVKSMIASVGVLVTSIVACPDSKIGSVLSILGASGILGVCVNIVYVRSSNGEKEAISHIHESTYGGQEGEDC